MDGNPPITTREHYETIRETNRLIGQALNILQESNRNISHYITMGMLNNQITSNDYLTGRNRTQVRNMPRSSHSVRIHDYERELPNNFLEPVIVRPTETQILAATRLLIFGDIEIPEWNVCSITQERFNATDLVLKIRHCGHYFDRAALSTWFRTSTLCPVCRYDIRNYTRTNTNTNNR